VLEGELQISGERDGAIGRQGSKAPARRGQRHHRALGVARHAQRIRPAGPVRGGGTLRADDGLLRGGRRGGGGRADGPGQAAAGPAALTEIAARYGIRFWGGA
jgi:hypothetical protein